jgi:REP element-mobilizing transposase RayT
MLKMSQNLNYGFPLAYHITFTCYGQRLHGCEEGSIDPIQNIPGTQTMPANPGLLAIKRERMYQPPYELDQPRREVVMAAIKATCEHRGWDLLAAHVRTTHVHVCLQSSGSPERAMNSLKAYASRELNKGGFDYPDRKRWARHGSTRYKWTVEAVEDTMNYIAHGQGKPMEMYKKP